MMRLGETKTFAGRARTRIPIVDRPLEDLLKIPHTTWVLARLAQLDPSLDSDVIKREVLEVQRQDAAERDALADQRPGGCWCFGRGGMGERAVIVPGSEVPMVLGTYCRCPDGEARRHADDEVRQVARAFAEQVRLTGIWEAVRVPERFRDCTLETFPSRTPSMRDVVAWLRAWLVDEHWALVLHGGFGVGKTGLGVGALKDAAQRRQVGLFVKAPDLLSRIRATYGKNSDATELEVLDSLRTVTMLLLDDVGADRATDWATEMLFQVLDARHDSGLKTIITTNLDKPDLAVHLGPRTMHRFDEGAVFIHVDGPNLRKDQKGN